MELKADLQAEYAAYKANNSHDSYSARVVSYGDAWAAAMEAAMSLGASVPECAEQASKDADTDGITGYMYGSAASALSHFWKHGDALRAWHNRQYLDENAARAADKSGGVVNPAIMTINT